MEQENKKSHRAIDFIHRSLFFLFAVFCLELIFRWAVFPEWKDLSPKIHEMHPVYGRFSLPNITARQFDPPNYNAVISTNSMGFRDREEGFVEKDLKGIWVCGGSNGFGNGINDGRVFTDVMEKSGYRTANLAAEGSQIAIESRVIRHLNSLGHKPRAVLCVITTPGGIKPFRTRIADFDKPLGQFSNATLGPQTGLGGVEIFNVNFLKKLPVNEPRYLIGLTALKTRLVKSSAIYGWLKYGVGDIPALHQFLMKYGLRKDADLHISGYAGLYKENLDAEARERLAGMTAMTARLEQYVREDMNVPFGIVLLPSQHQIYPQKFAKYVSSFGLSADDYDPTLINDRFAGMLRSKGIQVLDVTAKLIEASTTGPVTFVNNAHINERGHAVVGREIAKWISGSLKIPVDLKPQKDAPK